jgi:hypothetical protein
MTEFILDITAIAFLLLLIVLFIRYKYAKPHSEYLKLVEEMPEYDPADLAVEELKEKIDETQHNLEVVEGMIATAKAHHKKLHTLRHKMISVRLRLLKYEMLKRELEKHIEEVQKGDERTPPL